MFSLVHELAKELVRVCVTGRIVRAKRDDARAGERGNVDDGVDFAERIGVHERVCEGEAPLRVRVDHLPCADAYARVVSRRGRVA